MMEKTKFIFESRLHMSVEAETESRELLTEISVKAELN